MIASDCFRLLLRSQVYPGAFFNESVLYAPHGSGTLTTAVAKEKSLVLRVSSERLAEMQHTDPHKAHQLVLCIFKQVMQVALIALIAVIALIAAASISAEPRASASISAASRASASMSAASRASTSISDESRACESISD